MTEAKQNPMISNVRVLDERAFVEFSDRLSALIKEADDSSRNLDDLVGRTQSLSDTASSAKSQLDQRLELSARVLKITKGQLDRVEGALGALSDSQRKVDDLSADLKSQLGDFNVHLERAMEEVDKRVTDAVQGLDDQRRDGDESRDRLEQLMALARRLGEHFTAVEGQLSGGIETFQSGLRQALDEIASGNTQSERASSTLDEQVFALKSRVAAFADGIEQWLKPALAEMETQRQDVARAGDDTRHLVGEMSARVNQSLKDIEDRINIGLADFTSRHQSSERSTEVIREAVQDLRTQCAEWTGDLRERFAQVGGLAAEINQRIGDVREQLAETLGDEMREQLAGMHEKLGGVDTRLDAAAAQRTKIADGQTQLREVLLRLEDRLSTALLALDDRQDVEDQRIGGQLSAVREQLAALGTRIESEVEPLLGTLRQRLRDDLESKLIAATERLDSRVAEILTELEERSRRVEDDTSANRDQLARLLELMSGAVERLEDQVTNPLRDLVRSNDEGSGRVTRTLDDMRDKIERAAAELHGEVTGSLAELTSRGSEQGERVTREVSQIKAELKQALARLDERVEGSLAELARGATRQDEGLAQRIGELHEAIAAISRPGDNQTQDAKYVSGIGEIVERLGAIEERGDALASTMEAGIEAMRRGRVDVPTNGLTESGSDGRVEQRLADLQDQLRDSTEQVDCRVAEILAELGRGGGAPAAGHAPSGGGVGDAIAGLEERLTEAMAKAGRGVLPSGNDGLADLEDRLGALSDQLRVVDGRLVALEPQLEGLEQREVGAGGGDLLAKTMGGLEDRLKELVNRSEQRVLEALAKLETRLAAEAGAPPEASRAASAPASASAPPKAAVGPSDPRKVVSSLVAAVNSGDAEAIRRFVATEYAASALADRGVDDRIDVYVSFHEDAGELELRNIEKSDENEIVALVQERGTLEWHRLQFQLDPRPPHKIMVVNIDSV